MTNQEYQERLKKLLEERDRIQSEYNANKSFIDVQNDNPSFLNKVGYVGKNVGLGAKRSVWDTVTALPQSYAVGLQRGAKQAEQEQSTWDKIKNIGKNYVKAVGTIDPVTKLIYMGTIGREETNDRINQTATQIANNYANADSTWKKITAIGGGLGSYAIGEVNSGIQALQASGQGVGELLGVDKAKQATQAILNFDDKLHEKTDKEAEELAKEGQKYDWLTQKFGEAGQSVGYMAPSIAINFVTGGGSSGAQAVGLTQMGLASKANTTREAMKQGADLETAERKGIASGTIEAGTELMWGGLDQFRALKGKGGIEQTLRKGVENGIEKYLKNGTLKKVAGKIGEWGLDVGGEIVEETVSDILGKWIERGTTNPNEDYYTFKDWANTAFSTALSTTMSNVGQKVLKTGADKAIEGINKVSDKVYNRNSERVENQQSIEEAERVESDKYKENLQGILNNANMPDEIKSQLQPILNSDATINSKEYNGYVDDLKTVIKANTQKQIIDTSNTLNQQYMNIDNQLAELDNIKPENFKDQESRKFYAQQMNKEFSDNTLDTILATYPENRNGNRTVKQYKEIAKAYGQQMALNGLTFDEVRANTVGAWQYYEPNKNITRYDNKEHKNQSFDRLNSQVWSQEVYDSYRDTMKTQLQQQQEALSTQMNDEVARLQDEEDILIDTIDNLKPKASPEQVVRTQKLVEDFAKRRGVKVEYNENLFKDNNEEAFIKDNGNGERTIYINPNADPDTILVKLATHEMFHDTIRTKPHDKLTKLVMDRLKADENYDMYRESVREAYQEQLQGLTEAEQNALLDEEMTAKYLGEYLGDEQFVQQLVNSTNRSTIQKIMDWIDNRLQQIKNVVTGNKEAEYWRKVRENFEKAYNSKYQGQEGTQYSIQIDNKGRTLTKEQQEYFKDSKVRDENGNLLEVYHGTKTNGINVFKYNPKKQTGTDYGKAFYFTTDYTKAQGYQYNVENDPAYIKYNEEYNKMKDYAFEEGISEEEKDRRIKELSKWFDNNSIYDIMNDENYTPERMPSGETKKLYLNITNPYTADAKGKYYYEVYDKYFEEARKNNNDGIIVKNVIDVATGEHRPIDVYIAFNENQIKNVDNLKPTENLDIRYSKKTAFDKALKQDNQGRKLTDYVIERTKDVAPQLRDEEGHLMLMLHGSPNGEIENLNGGTYFTPSREYAERYKNTSASSISSGKVENNPRVYEAYLDIKKPFDLSDKTARDIYINDYIKGGNALGINPYLTDAEYNKIDNIDWTEVEDLKEFLQENGYDYDGIIANEGGDLDNNGNVLYRGNSYIPFNENQIIKANDNNTKYSKKTKFDEALQKDNQGNTINPGMQEYLEDVSPEELVDGKVPLVYHTTTDETSQFNIFNPVGTPYYRFGNQVVNYYTDSKDMSGSYASSKYKMADTKKLNNIEEAKQYLYDYGRTTGNLLTISQNESGKYVLNQEKQTNNEARNFVDNLSEDEMQQMRDNIFYDKDMEGTPYEYAFSWDKFDKSLQEKFKNVTDKYTGTADLVDLENEIMKYVRQPELLLNNDSINGEIVKEYNSEDELLRNIKEDIGKTNWSKNSRVQYQGYVKLTNPYVVDAEERNWNQVVSQSNDFIDELTETVSEDTINNLSRLYKESQEISADARAEYYKYDNIIQSINTPDIGFNEYTVDNDTQSMNHLLRRTSLNDILLLDSGDTNLGVSTWFNIADVLQQDGIIGEATAKNITDDFKLPEQVKNWIHNELYKEINVGLEDVHNLKELYEKKNEAYQKFDKYRYETSYFKEKIMADESEEGYVDLGELNDLLEQRAEVRGADVVADEIAQASSVGFSKPELIRLWGTSKTTNDIVKEVIASNQDGTTSYDGVIIKNVYDYGGKSEGEKAPANVYVTFNSNQFKAQDNQNPTSDPDIRYNIKSKAYDDYLKANNPNRSGVTIGDLQQKLPTKQKTTQPILPTTNAQETTEENRTIQEKPKTNTTKELIKNESIPNYIKDLVNENIDKLQLQKTVDYINDNLEAYIDLSKNIEKENKNYNEILKDNNEFEFGIMSPKEQQNNYLARIENSINNEVNDLDTINFYESNGLDNPISASGNVNENLEKYQSLKAKYDSDYAIKLKDYNKQINEIDSKLNELQDNQIKLYFKNEQILRDKGYIKYKLKDGINDMYITEKGKNSQEAQQLIKEIKASQKEYKEASFQLQNQKNELIENAIKSVTKKQLEVPQPILPTTKGTQTISSTIEEPTLKVPVPKGETGTEQKVARVLSEPITKVKPEQRAWALFKANILDKGAVFEDLSFKAKNRELQAKWDSTLLAEAKGQNAIGQARYEFENGEEKQVSKALTDIIDEVGENSEDFNNYMYHQLNIDRMTLEDRFDIANKPVFGDGIDANYSKQKVAELEKAHPEFKEYAQDVYDYLDTNKKELVDNGVISQETSDRFKEMYPHYVPIARIDAKGLAINVPLDTNRTGVNSPIKRAKGGSQDIQPLFQTMANRTMQTYKASSRNSFGLELKNTLNNLGMFNQLENAVENTDNENIFEYDADKGNLQEGNKYQNPTFTVFDNGEKVTYEINQDMYDALKPKNEIFSKWDNTKLMKATRKFNDIRRGILTEYNPAFSITNAIKDAQDVLMNSQHAGKTYAKFGEAYSQILKKGYWYKEYVQNGGSQNSYFTDGDFVKQDSKVKSIIKMPLEAISNVNNVIEMAPRLAEYIASREQGKSVQSAMLDASRVTTNFKAGGDVTKFANRNGATFLNASVQGLQQNIRNIREANAKGLKGYGVLLGKAVIAGLPALILNNLVWKDDDDYKELQDYVKDNYYIIAKIGDHKFLRIPKGRTVAVIQKAVTNMSDFITNKDEIDPDKYSEVIWGDLKDTFELASNNLAPNNPIENNIVSPIVQAVNNKTWYGEDLVPSRLKDKPNEEKYDESTAEISKQISGVLNKIGIKSNPMQINYLLDQYGGGVADVLLPMGTPQAENNMIEDKFTTDSVMKSRYPGEFFELKDKLAENRNSSKATDEDELLYKYADNVSGELSDLYKKKREIQNSSLTDKEKKKQIAEVQKQINSKTQQALKDIKEPKVSGNTATIGNSEYIKTLNANSGEYQWNKLTDKTRIQGISLKTQADYQNRLAKYKQKTGDSQLSDKEEAQIILDGNYSSKDTKAIYIATAGKKDTLYKSVSDNLNIDEYLNYKTANIQGVKGSNGKTINGTKKQAQLDYINNNISGYENRLLLIGKDYKLSRSQQQDLAQYIYSQDNAEELFELFDKNFTVRDGTVYYK